MDKGTLHVHEVELVVNTRECLSNGSRVSDHANSALDAGKVASRNKGWRLVVDTTLESSWAPIHELDSTLGLDSCNGRVDILGDNISTVHEAAGHVLSVARITLGHHVGGFKHRVGDLSNRELFMHCLLVGDYGCIGRKHKVDTRVRHQVGLELRHVHIEGSIEAKRGSERGNNLSDESVKVGVSGGLNTKVAPAHIVKGLVVQAEGAVSVLEESVGGEDRVVRLDNRSRNLRGRRDSEGELGFASVVNGEPLEKERTQTRSSTTSSGVEDKETLETSAVISELTDTIKDKIDNLLSGSVMSTSVVIGGVLLSIDDLLGMVKLTVGSVTHFITNGGLQINVHSTWNMLSRASLAEEGVEGIIRNTLTVVGLHGTIGGNSMLETVKFPALISDLDTGLTQMNRNTFTHCFKAIDSGIG
mmetsp:Transcript_7590/g.17414  ORF Transcript_7590/g.17414 Transcript_7590/m.17414 type:complete len:417 (+) Transcript_7590:484-1734(+)